VAVLRDCGVIAWRVARGARRVRVYHGKRVNRVRVHHGKRVNRVRVYHGKRVNLRFSG